MCTYFHHIYREKKRIKQPCSLSEVSNLSFSPLEAQGARGRSGKSERNKKGFCVHKRFSWIWRPDYIFFPTDQFSGRVDWPLFLVDGWSYTFSDFSRLVAPIDWRPPTCLSLDVLTPFLRPDNLPYLTSTVKLLRRLTNFLPSDNWHSFPAHPLPPQPPALNLPRPKCLISSFENSLRNI